MKEGHPFLTEEFDALRSRQRLDLRMVEDWLVEDFWQSAPLEQMRQPSDRALVEHELRALAEKQREAIADLLTSVEKAVRSYEMYQFLRSADEARPTHDFLLAEAINSLDATHRENRVGRHPEGEALDALKIFILTLGWADLLADDGYRDPRMA